MSKTADRVKETTTTTGTGTLNLAGAVSGFRTFVAGIGDGKVCYYAIDGGTEWEVGIGTVTDAATDTLSRTTVLASSNAGALVNFSAGTKTVFVTIPPAGIVVDPGIAGGRLTASSTLPVTIADTKSTILYYLPHVGDKVALFDGTSWRLHTIPSAGVQLTVDGALTTGHNYDIFLYDNAGTMTLDAEDWSSHAAGTSARGSNVPVRQDGAWVKTGALTRRYLGTIRVMDDAGTEKCQDAIGFRYIWNVQNRVRSVDFDDDSTNSWTASGVNGTWSPINSTSALPWRHQFVCGEPSVVKANIDLMVLVQGGQDGFHSSVALNTGTAQDRNVASIAISYASSVAGVVNAMSQRPGIYTIAPVGYNFVQGIETTNANILAPEAYGDGARTFGGSISPQSGMYFEWEH